MYVIRYQKASIVARPFPRVAKGAWSGDETTLKVEHSGVCMVIVTCLSCDKSKCNTQSGTLGGLHGDCHMLVM